MNRNLLKLFCLVVSLLIWGQVASTRYVVRELELPLELAGLSEGLTLAGNGWPEDVRLRARVSKWRFLLHRYFGQQLGRAVIDISGVRPGGAWQREITVNDVLSPLEEIVITPPQRLMLEVDRVDSLLVPVLVETIGDLPDERMLVAPLRADPDSLILMGPSRFFAGGEVLRTEPVDLSRLNQERILGRRLVMPHPHLRSERVTVDVRADVAVIGRRTFDHVPVVPLVDADQPDVELFPPVATLTVTGPEDSLAVLTAARISITLSLSGWAPGAHTLRPEVQLPPLFDVEALIPEDFMAVIGGDRSGDTE